MVFEGAPLRDELGRVRIEELRSLVDQRLALVPRFRQIPVAPPIGLGRPQWVDDPNFDIAHHVRLTALPAPGTPAQLNQLCCDLYAELLDRSRSLWELWVVDGLVDGRVGLIEKVHHSMVDGVAGVDVAMALMDPDPDHQWFAPRSAAVWAPQPPPAWNELAMGALEDVLAVPLGVGRQVRRLVTSPRARVVRAASVLRGGLSLSEGGLLAPKLSINRPLAGGKRLLDQLTVPMAEVKAVGAAFGTTVNDVALAAVAGGLGRLLRERGEDAVRVRALVPVSTRPIESRGDVGNAVAAIVVSLPVGEVDPVGRLRMAADAMRRRKSVGQATATGALVALADSLPSAIATAMSSAVHRQPFVNLVVTNVPGSPFPVYMMGSRLESVVPVVPLARNLNLSIGVFSYAGQLSFGLLADADLVPDLHCLAEGIEKSLAELSAAAGAGTRSPKE